MVSRVFWLLFASWAVFLPMVAFGAEYNANVNGYGASDEREDNNFIDWMGMSRDAFIRKYPPGTVHDKGDLTAAIDIPAIYALDGRKEKEDLSIGMSVQLCDALPEALKNGNLSDDKQEDYFILLDIARKVLNDKAESLMTQAYGLKHTHELYRR
eukprot:860338_1